MQSARPSLVFRALQTPRTALLSLALLVGGSTVACGDAADGAGEAEAQQAPVGIAIAQPRATISKRRAKIARMVTGAELERFELRNHGRIRHYAGLGSAEALSSQILFQLFREEGVHEADEENESREARKASRVGTLAAPSPAPLPAIRSAQRQGFVRHNRSNRRHAYATPFFAALEANRRDSVNDIGLALARPQIPREERVEILKLLHALVKDEEDATSVAMAKELFLRYAMQPFDASAADYTPHLAFAFYARLETRDADRAANGARFIRVPHAEIPPQLARRMFNSTSFHAIRAATRISTVGAR